MPRFFTLLFAIALSIIGLAPGAFAASQYPVKGLYRVSSPTQIQALELAKLGLDVAGYHAGEYFDFIGGDDDVAKVRQAGFPLIMLMPDADAAFRSFSARAEFGAFHTYNEITSELLAYEQAYPTLAKRTSLGTSIEGRTLWALKISDDVNSNDASEPDVLITGCTHAREIISTEIPMGVIQALLEGYGNDPLATFLVENREIWIVPLVNPDGHNRVVQYAASWRKNARNNGDGTFGVDLNRNYGYQWGYDNVGSSPFTFNETYRGTSPFSEPETQALRAFALSHNVVRDLHYHSYGDMLLIPWGYIPADTSDHALFRRIGSAMVASNGYRLGNYADGTIYGTNGDADDYFYGSPEKMKSLSYTFEVGNQFAPPESQIPVEVEETLLPTLILAQSAGPYAEVGTVTVYDGTGDSDGMADPGETVEFTLDMENSGFFNLLASTGTLASQTAGVTILQGSGTFPAITSGGHAVSGTPRFQVQFSDALAEPTEAAFRLTLADTNNTVLSIPFSLHVTRASSVCAFTELLNTNPGWSISGGQWSFGQPTGQGGSEAGNPDPTSGATGTNVYGTNLTGDYPNNITTPARLRSPVIDCSALTGTTLNFARWLNVEESVYDQAAITVLNSTSSVQVWKNGGRVTDSSWQQVELDISALADGDPHVEIEFSLTSDGGLRFSGWNLDDISVCGYELPTPVPTTTATPSSTVPPTSTPTSSPTVEPSSTPTPSGTMTLTPTSPPTDTPAETPTPTDTLMPTLVPTNTSTPLPNPSATPAPSSSPTSTPTIEPPPVILAAGYWDTSLVSGQPSHLTILAFVPGPDVTKVEVAFQGVPTGILLHDDGLDGDAVAGDSLFTLFYDLPNYTGGAGRVLLELQATDGHGQTSRLWPYLSLDEPVAAPEPLAFLQRWTMREARSEAPEIRLGASYTGDEADGRLLHILVYVYHPRGATSIAGVDLLYHGTAFASLGQASGAGAWYEGLEGFYWLQVPLGSGPLPGGQFLVEAQARGTGGQLSGVYPYLYFR